MEKSDNERRGILTIGNLLVDRTLLIAEYPQESMLTTISKIERHCGGGCTNTLFNLAKLDPTLPLYLGGAIGKDSDGEFILENALQYKVNIDAVYQVDETTSFTDVMINSLTGDRTFFHYVGAMRLYELEHILQINNQAKIVHIAYLPLLPALLNNNILIRLFSYLRDKGFEVSIDLVSVNNKDIFKQFIHPILPYIDYVIINDVEARILVELDSQPSHSISLIEIADQILKMGVKNSVIVHSPEYAVACNIKQEQISIPSYWVEKQHIISTLGAGDAFCAGVLYGLHQNLPLVDILKLGHSLAYFNLFSISATDGAVSYEQVKRFQQSQH